MVELDENELLRYDRQMRLPNFGVEGQKKLKAAKVTVAGVGGLGCPVSIYLAAAGVGTIQIIDKDVVELSNLNRQILHWDKDIGRNKVDSAGEKLLKLNRNVHIQAVHSEITEENVQDLIRDSDVVIDAMDNFRTRLVINKACVDLGKPFIHAGIYGLEGQLLTVLPGNGPCLRCFLQCTPPEVRPFPVLGATPAVMASFQVIEAVKLLTGTGKTTAGKLIIFDGENLQTHSLKIQRSPSCEVCGHIGKHHQ